MQTNQKASELFPDHTVQDLNLVQTVQNSVTFTIMHTQNTQTSSVTRSYLEEENHRIIEWLRFEGTSKIT